jgi:4-hydroxy-3-methylbut-2-enyl diphosphate reductase
MVSQTTLDRDLFDNVVKALSDMLANLTVMDTICDSTRNRQDDVHEGIRKGIDTLIVVGGKNSANTTRLAEIGQEHGIKTFHIETEDELVFENLRDSGHVLVTAGASTPGWIINNVLERLYDIKYRKSNLLLKYGKVLLEFLVRTNSLSATFAFVVTWFLKSNRGYPADFSLPLISMLYIFSMYSTNNYLDRNFLRASNSHKYGIYRKYGNVLMLVSLAMLAASFYLILDYSIITKTLLILSYVCGLIYFSPPVRHFINALKIPLIKNFYSSKIVTSLGWLTVVVIVPSLQFGLNPLLAFFIMTLVLCIITIRHLLLGMVAYQGDFIFGRISLPIWLGQKRTDILCYSLSALTLVSCAAATVFSGNYLLPALTVPVFYYLILHRLVTRIEYPISLRYEILIDINLVISSATFLMII